VLEIEIGFSDSESRFSRSCGGRDRVFFSILDSESRWRWKNRISPLFRYLFPPHRKRLRLP